MSHSAAARNAAPGSDVGCYQRHRPEQTLLYRIVEQHHPAFTAHLAAQGTVLPGYVQREFEDQCGRLEHSFLRVRCDTCHAEHLVTFSWPLSRIPALRGISESLYVTNGAAFAPAAGREQGRSRGTQAVVREPGATWLV